MAQIVYVFKKAGKQIPAKLSEMPPKDFQIFRAAKDNRHTRTIMWRAK